MSGSKPESEIPAGAAVETPGAVKAPAVEAVAVEIPAEAPPAREPSLLETLKAPGDEAPTPVTEEVDGDKAPEPEKPAEVKPPAEGDKPAEPPVKTKPAAPEVAEIEAVEPIAYPEWTLPEGVSPDKAALSQYNAVLQAHRVPPEVGQALLDQHVASISKFREEFAAQVSRDQWTTFGNTCKDWEKKAMADPEIGGSGHQTALHAIARVRDATISTHRPDSPEYAKDVAAFNEFLSVTGAGSHPQFLKMLHRMARYIDEPRLPPANAGAVPNGGMPKKRGFDYAKSGGPA